MLTVSEVNMQNQAWQQWKRQKMEGAAGGSRGQRHPQLHLKLLDNLNYKRPVKRKSKCRERNRENEGKIERGSLTTHCRQKSSVAQGQQMSSGEQSSLVTGSCTTKSQQQAFIKCWVRLGHCTKTVSLSPHHCLYYPLKSGLSSPLKAV